MTARLDKTRRMAAGWLLAGGLLLLAGGCHDERFDPPAEGPGGGVGQPVRFRTQIQADQNHPPTRGLPVAGGEYPDGGSFGVFAYRLPGTEWVAGLTANFMYNIRVTRSGNDYRYDQTQYWPDAYLRLFAYHPYAMPDNGITPFAAASVGNPYLQVRIDPRVTNQTDLLLAATDPLLAPGSANFAFRHALTRLNFVVAKSAVSAEVKVRALTLKNIVGAGTVSLVPRADQRFEWTPSTLYDDVTEYTVAVPDADGTERGLIPPDQQQITATGFQDITSPAGALLLIPQQITAGRSLLVVHYAVDGLAKTQEVLLPPTSPGSATEWLSGKYVTYQVTIRVDKETEEIILSAADARANCILLDSEPQQNPSADLLQYAIPVAQANLFYDLPELKPWNGGLTGLSPTDPWGVQVIWMDKANLLSIVKRHGTGAADNDQGRFAVQIPAGNQGNALVGIYKDSNNNQLQDPDEPWLWSWHLWVTNYNPNRMQAPASLNNASGAGFWQVQNGQIHRYRNGSVTTDNNNGNYGSADAWTPLTGLYAGKAMMDRNLGSLSAAFPTLENDIPFEAANLPQRTAPLHVLYYEYGRKDPFLSNAYRYREDGSALNTVDRRNETVTLLYAIQNPEKYIHGRQSWADDKPESSHWYDPRHPATPDRSAATGRKSLFDPCPAGWRLPVNGTWSDFNEQTFGWDAARRGKVYRPDPQTEIYYPADGFRAASTAEVKQTGYHGVYWGCSPIPNNHKDYCFRFASPERNLLEGSFLLDAVIPSAEVYQTDSFSVRCVQDE